MNPKPLLEVGQIRQHGLGVEEAQRDDSTAMVGVYVGVITAVYPVGHPDNTWGQTVVDVEFNHLLPPWRKVPLGAPYAHGETEKAVPNSRRRQPYDPKARHQMEGDTRDLRPGTRVLIEFPSGDLRAPVVIGCLKFNLQGEKAAPVERVGVDRFGDDGHFAMKEVTPVDSSMDEYPRARDTFNGSTIERDNRGNTLVQSTTDHDPVFPGHNRIAKAPDPQGNIVLSARGAKVGRIGLVTGKHPITGDAGDGSIRIETIDAAAGNLIGWVRSKAGRIWVSTRGSGDSRVYVENDDRSYLSLSGERASLHAAAKAFLDAAEVCLGTADPQYHAVLWEPLRELFTTFFTDYDGHVHTGVESGEDSTGPPQVGFLLKWIAQFQLGATFESNNVRLTQDDASSPEYETDPDGGDSAPEPKPPVPPSPTPAPRRKGGAGGGGQYGVFGSGGSSGGGGFTSGGR